MLHQTNGHKKENVPFYKKTTEQSAALSRLGEKQKKALPLALIVEEAKFYRKNSWPHASSLLYILHRGWELQC